MNSKKHKLPRRILAMLLAICMFVTMFPSAMFAVGGGVSYDDKTAAEEATGVTANKSVSGPDEDGNYTVMLDVKGTTTTSDEIQNVPADIVLVVDTSTSMERTVGRCQSTSFEEETRGSIFGEYTIYVCNECGEEHFRKPQQYCNASLNRLDVAKAAAKNFVNGLMGTGNMDTSNDVRIGLYDFSGSHRTKVDLTDVDGRQKLIDEIDDLSCPDWGDGTE